MSQHIPVWRWQRRFAEGGFDGFDAVGTTAGPDGFPRIEASKQSLGI